MTALPGHVRHIDESPSRTPSDEVLRNSSVILALRSASPTRRLLRPIGGYNSQMPPGEMGGIQRKLTSSHCCMPRVNVSWTATAS
jgi:hypothetical protein